jgi:hypothetical protein
MKPQAIVNKWRSKLFLGEWYFSFCDAKEDITGDGNGNVIADISVNPVYMTAVIKTFPAYYRKDKDTQEHSIVHEMCHCITEESWDAMDALVNGRLVTPKQQRDIIERLTQRIANAVYYGKK